MASGKSNDTDVMDALSDESVDIQCTMCKRKGRNREAEKYCVECRDYYCLMCVKVHEDIPSVIKHLILDKDQFPRDSIKIWLGTSKAQQPAPSERWDRHDHHIIDMVCQNDDDAGGGTCSAVDHRYKDSFDIPEFLQNNTYTTTVRGIQQKLESVDKTLAEHYENYQQEKERLLKRKTTILENIKKYRKEINDRLDELETNTVSDIEDKYKAFTDDIEKVMRLLETNKATVKSTIDKLTLAGDDKLQIFESVKQGENIADNAVKAIETSQLQQQSEDIDFIADHRLTSLLEEINVFGVATKAANLSTESIDKSEPLLQVKGSTTYHVKVHSDRYRCDINSACTLEDGTLLLADRDNRRLKRLDCSTFTVIDFCDIRGNPGQVCSINEQQAAVCLKNKAEVRFISLSNKMALANKIKTDFKCLGLAYANDSLYISDRNTSVYIYSVEGRKMKQFIRDESGQKLFHGICSLTANESGSRIYAVDYKNGLIVLDNEGNVVGRFNGSQFKGAYGSCITRRGSMLVCAFLSNNVLHFGRDGKLIDEVVEFGDKSANHQAICCNKQMSKMIIGRDRDEIEVYDLI